MAFSVLNPLSGCLRYAQSSPGTLKLGDLGTAVSSSWHSNDLRWKTNFVLFRSAEQCKTIIIRA